MSLTCTNGTTTSGQSVYAVGNIPQLGSWSPASAVKLDATNYPTWTATVANLPGHGGRVEVHQASGGQLPSHR